MRESGRRFETGALEAYLREHEARHLAELFEFLSIPSVSTLPEHRADVRRAAEWLAGYLERIGFDNVSVFPTELHPIVYAERIEHPGAPTALIYGHYDVQPVDPVHRWTTPPFEPAVRDGKIWARGASDDKGQVFAHLLALRALIEVEGRLPFNVKLLIEGEEEVTSVSLPKFLEENKDLIRADLVVISDTTMVAEGVPTICCGLRGLVDLEVSVYGAKRDLHSGLYGGMVANPIHVLVQLLASLRQGQGRILVPGFYDGVAELSERERREIAALPFDESAVARELGVAAFDGEPGYTPHERATVRPTVEVNGIWGGFQGEGSKTVIPSEAHAKITCRLVPDQDPVRVQEAVAAHFIKNCPPSATVKVRKGAVARPWRCDPDSPAIRAAVRALEEAYGRPVAKARLGGSIPVVETLDRMLAVPCVLIAFAQPGCNAHAPDENIPLSTLQTAPAALVRFWRNLAEADL